MSRLYYAFQYDSGLHTTYASNPNQIAGEAKGFHTKKMRDAACNDYVTSFMNGGVKVHPVRAVSGKQLREMGHSDAMRASTEYGRRVRENVPDKILSGYEIKDKMYEYASTLPPSTGRAQCINIAELAKHSSGTLAERILNDHVDAGHACRAMSLVVSAGCAIEETETPGFFGVFTFRDGSSYDATRGVVKSREENRNEESVD